MQGELCLVTCVMHDENRLDAADRLEHRDRPDRIHRSTASISDHGGLDGGVDTEYLVGIQTRVGTAEQDNPRSSLHLLSHDLQCRRRLVIQGKFAECLSVIARTALAVLPRYAYLLRASI